jgi:sugar phosphate isomerase/epimerase
MRMFTAFLIAQVCSIILFAAFLYSPAMASERGIGGSFKGPVGLQLYSLREQFNKNVPATLDEVKSWGIHYAELAGTYGQTPGEFKDQLEKRGIKPISAHFAYERFRDDPEAVAREAEALGIKYAGCAWIPHEDPFTEKACREAAAVFNHAGDVLAQHGIKFFYHVHGYEFQPSAGGTLLDVLFQNTSKKHVSYEMDVFWIVFPGQDPVKLLQKYKKRWELMHLKDMKKGLATGALTGHTDVANDVALGAGQIDMIPLLRAAKKAGVRWYFIEDESPVSEKQIPESLSYLEKVKF